jgi:hypothetical protein
MLFPRKVIRDVSARQRTSDLLNVLLNLIQVGLLLLVLARQGDRTLERAADAVVDTVTVAP